MIARGSNLWPLLVGGVTGLALGMATGFFGRSPLFGESLLGYIVIPVALGLAEVAVLVAWIALTRSPAPVLALSSFIALCLVGMYVAPPPPGALIYGSGRVTIGTEAAPSTYFSGTASCELIVGDPYVMGISGFSWAVSDPARYAALDLDGPANVERIHLGTGARPIGSEASIEFGGGQQAIHGSFVAFPIETVRPDGRTGTAHAADGSITISWTCT